jgi:hypothetical protein
VNRVRCELSDYDLDKKMCTDLYHIRTVAAAGASIFNHLTFTVMEGWSKLQSSIGNLNLGQSAGKLAKGFNSSVQATKERLGQVAPDEITELPQGTPYDLSVLNK